MVNQIYTQNCDLLLMINLIHQYMDFNFAFGNNKIIWELN